MHESNTTFDSGVVFIGNYRFFFVLLICSGWLQGTLLMVFYGLPDESYVLSRTAAYCNVDI